MSTLQQLFQCCAWTTKLEILRCVCTKINPQVNIPVTIVHIKVNYGRATAIYYCFRLVRSLMLFWWMSRLLVQLTLSLMSSRRTLLMYV